MKKMIFGSFFAIAISQVLAQPVGKTDIVALLNEIPAAPLTLADAFQRAYAPGATHPDAMAWYKTWTNKMEQAALETQSLTADFYRKYPTGVRPTARPVATASPQHQASMDAATSELAQKMLSDPAFAQKFMAMSEKEQHAYIAGVMADKGIKPVQGTPNVNTAPVPGTDIEWATLCSDYSTAAMEMTRWEAQAALESKYQTKHDEVNAWATAAIDKLPMISFGEYGHDHDPEQVKAIQKQALQKHREVAEAMLKEASAFFAKYRQQAAQRLSPLADALKSVQYGANYDFGVFYPTVISTQTMMISELDVLLKNEVKIIEECAHWEYDWRNFK